LEKAEIILFILFIFYIAYTLQGMPNCDSELVAKVEATNENGYIKEIGETYFGLDIS